MLFTMTLRKRKTSPQPPQQEVEIQHMTATSSSHLLWPLSIYHASNVLSNSSILYWNSGVYAPASICLEIHKFPIRLTRIALQIEMLPDGQVYHEIRAGPRKMGMQFACKIEGVVSHGNWISIPVDCENVRYITITTHVSPSFVAWRRIRVWKSEP